MNDQDPPVWATISEVAQSTLYARTLHKRLESLRAVKSAVTRAKLAGLRGKSLIRCACFRLSDLELVEQLAGFAFPVALQVETFADLDSFQASGFDADLAILRSHQFGGPGGSYDLRPLHVLQGKADRCVTAIWLWDHHHQIDLSCKMALLADLVFPMHETVNDYLKIFNDHVFSAVPAATAQWGGPDSVHELYLKYAQAPRSNRLYGGFVAYDGYARNDLIRACMAAIPDHDLTLRPPSESRDVEQFDPAQREARFAEWVSHKCSLVYALAEDMPIRLFDALVCGQIPLVPHNLNGFDLVISPRLQQSLPIVRFDPTDIGSVKTAWETALALYDQGGAAAARRRHDYARQHHTMPQRVIDMILTVLTAAHIFPVR